MIVTSPDLPVILGRTGSGKRGERGRERERWEREGEGEEEVDRERGGGGGGGEESEINGCIRKGIYTTLCDCVYK